MKTALKWPVPVDDAEHPVGSGRVIHVACQDGYETVQVWTEEPTDGPRGNRLVRVFATGQPVPTDYAHLGTAVAAGGALVWHVYETSHPGAL